MPRKIFQHNKLAIILMIFLSWFVVAFVINSLPLPAKLFGDWPYFLTAGRLVRELDFRSLYGGEELLFFNPPWVAVLLVPLSIFPAKFGAALITGISITFLIMLSKRYELSRITAVLFILSPPVVSSMVMAQIDSLLLAGLLLPVEWWGLVALSKPQNLIGIGFTPVFEKEKILKAVWISLLIIVISFLVFGNWVQEIFSMALPTGRAWNLWAKIWPWNLVPGVLILVLGLYHRNELLLLSASPFLFPYTTLGSFIGCWLAIHTQLKPWQAALFLLISWIVYLSLLMF